MTLWLRSVLGLCLVSLLLIGCGKKDDKDNKDKKDDKDKKSDNKDSKDGNSKITKENFDKLKDKKTEKEIVDILGDPTEKKDLDNSEKQLIWKSGNNKIDVFISKEGKVVDKGSQFVK